MPTRRSVWEIASWQTTQLARAHHDERRTYIKWSMCQPRSIHTLAIRVPSLNLLVIFSAAYGAVLVAEIMGDKLIYTTGVLATRFQPKLVVLGMAAASMVKMAVAVLVGQAISDLPPALTGAISGASFVLLAFALWRHREPKQKARLAHKSSQAVMVSFATIVSAEWGDIGQLTAAAVASRFASPYVVWFGAVSAMVTKGILAAALGSTLRRWAQERFSGQSLRRASLAILLAFGIAVVAAQIFVR